MYDHTLRQIISFGMDIPALSDLDTGNGCNWLNALVRHTETFMSRMDAWEADYSRFTGPSTDLTGYTFDVIARMLIFWSFDIKPVSLVPPPSISLLSCGAATSTASKSSLDSSSLVEPSTHPRSRTSMRNSIVVATVAPRIGLSWRYGRRTSFCNVL